MCMTCVVTLYPFIMFTFKFESNINFLLFLIFD